MRRQWTAKGNRDAGSSCSCDRGLHRYLLNFGGGGGLNTSNSPPRYATVGRYPKMENTQKILFVSSVWINRWLKLHDPLLGHDTNTCTYGLFWWLEICWEEMDVLWVRRSSCNSRQSSGREIGPRATWEGTNCKLTPVERHAGQNRDKKMGNRPDSFFTAVPCIFDTIKPFYLSN